MAQKKLSVITSQIMPGNSKRQELIWVLYLLPGLIVYALFMAYPLFNSMRLSFFTGTGYTLNNFIGFDNYKELFFNKRISSQFLGAFKNTWIFFFVHMLVQNTLGLLFANLLISKSLKGRNVYRTIIFIPATLAIVVTGFLWKLLLNPQWGALTTFLKFIGLSSISRVWLGDPQIALIVIALVSSWQWVGLPTMMFLAALQNIPEELFESAEIAGATNWQTFRHIKLPLLRPIIGVVSILTFTGNFNAFDVVFAMAGPNGSPNFSTDILGTYFYRIGIAGKHPVGIPNMGMGAAVATVIFLVLFIGVGILRVLTQEKKGLK